MFFANPECRFTLFRKCSQMGMLFKFTTACSVVAFVSTAFCACAEAQWGTMKGQIILDGEVPKIQFLVEKGNSSTKDAAVCAAHDIPNEKLVVDPITKGIANVVIYLAKKPAKVHPDLTKSKEQEVSFDQKGCRFLPHILLVRTDQRVRVLSDDAIAHNTHTHPNKNNSENFIVSPNDRTGVLLKTMTLVERAPMSVTCDIHPWMAAYWVVLDHPYAAVTDKNGNFEIANLPAGTHEFVVWQESAGFLDKKHTITIKEGANEQKPMKYAASQLLK
jgi:hypothetical protein